jgi:NAD+ synthase (glutamine-hydrolysing)
MRQNDRADRHSVRTTPALTCQDIQNLVVPRRGFPHDVVARVIRMVDLNEYKRRQAPVGIRVTQRGFGRDRRYPITSGWKAGD